MDLELKADLTKPTEELLTPPAKSAGEATATFLDFLHNTILLPMQKYNIKAKINLEKYEKELRREYDKISESERAEPSMNIWGKTLESLKWNFDDQQEYIREMFTNILISDVKKDKKDKVLPAFITIVEQLSKEDADFLKELYKTKIFAFSTIEFQWKNEREHYIKAPNSPFMVLKKDGTVICPSMKVIENLERLKILEWERGIYLIRDEEKCKQIFEKNKDNYKIPDHLNEKYQKVDFAQEKLSITEFGQAFMEICLDNEEEPRVEKK